MKEVVKKTKKEFLKLQLELIENLKKLIMTGFGLVAALAWNDAIKGLFAYIFPEKGTELKAQFLYAVLITLVVVLFTYYLSRITDSIKNKFEEGEKKDEE